MTHTWLAFNHTGRNRWRYESSSVAMAGQHVQVCMPWDQQQAKRLDREKERKWEVSQQPREECECVKTWTIIGARNPENSSSGNRSKEKCYREVPSYQYLALNCFSALFHSQKITMESANSVSCLLSILSLSRGGF